MKKLSLLVPLFSAPALLLADENATTVATAVAPKLDGANTAGKGLLYGNPAQLMIQIKAIIVTIIFTAIGTAVAYGISSLLTGGAKVSAEEESMGLDEATHGEKAFHL